MKKAILMMILAAMLTGCANSEEGEKTETAVFPQAKKPVSRTTTAAVTSSETTTSAAETTSTSKITTTITETETNLPKITTTRKKSETTTPKITTTTTKYVPTTEVQTYYEPVETEIVTENQTEWQPPETQDEPQNTTTATTKPPKTSEPKPQTGEDKISVEWSDSMKIWHKLCEGKNLSGEEKNIIRNEIFEYAQGFNGMINIHVNFGMDNYDISYENPLNLTADKNMTELSYAHMDAYCDADSSWLIDDANSEQEIYEIVADIRQDCLQIIDQGLFNRWEIYSENGALEYASEITFGVGFDGTSVWFLTED